MEGVIVFIVLIGLISGLLKSPIVKGKFGEFKVSQLLQKHLQPPVYQVLDNVTVPSINGTTQVDHVVVSPYGIFVIETKNYSGWIFGSARDRKWTQTMRSKKSGFQNPIRQNYAHIKALEVVTGQDGSVFHSIVVFVGDAKFKTMIPDGVCFASDLVDQIKSKGRRLLSEAEATAATQAIRTGRLEPGFKTDAVHVRNLGERFAEGAGTAFSRGMTSGLKKAGLEIVFKLVGVIVFIIVFMKVMDHVQESFRDLGSVTAQKQPVARQARPQTAAVTTAPQPRPATRATTRNPQSPLAIRQQQQREREAAQRVQWEQSLRCGYSIDTKRCACYDRKGLRADIRFERCIVLATGSGN